MTMDSVKRLPLNQWLVFNEIAASANAEGCAIDDPEVYAAALPLTIKQITQAINHLVLGGVLHRSSLGIAIANDWIDVAAYGVVQIEKVSRWIVQTASSSPGFALGTSLAPDSEISEKMKSFLLRSLYDSEKKRTKIKFSEKHHARDSSELPSNAPLAPGAPADAGARSQRRGSVGEEDRSFMPQVLHKDRFEQFWDAYPRHDRKDEAIRQWNRAIRCQESPDAIVEGAKRYGIYARKNNQPSYRLFQAGNFIKGASYQEMWGSDWTSRAEQRAQTEKVAHLITTFTAPSGYKFDLWSNMHPRAAEIKMANPGQFTLGDRILYFDSKRDIFMSYEEMFRCRLDGSPYNGELWWTTAGGRELLRRRRVLIAEAPRSIDR